MSTTAPPQPPVSGHTIGQILSRTVAQQPDQLAMAFPSVGNNGWQCTWAELDASVRQVEGALLALGLTRGAHVAVWATNVPQWTLLQLATARQGMVLVTINPAYRPYELKYVLAQSDAAALFLLDHYKTSDYFALLAEVCPAVHEPAGSAWQSPDFPQLSKVVALRGTPPVGILPWETFLAGAATLSTEQLTAGAALVTPHNVVNIQYTSGTTGFPKAAMLTHHNLLHNAYYVGACQQFGPADRLCIPVPFYHCFGCVMGNLASVVHGVTMVVPAESFRPAETLAAIERYRCTALYGVPTMFISLLQEPSLPARDLTSLRTGIMAGSPCPIEVMRQVVDRMHLSQITIAYGQTEAAPVITQSRVDDPLELRVETVGRPLPGVEVRIVDPATGAELGTDAAGELLTRGHGVMQGYYRDPTATARTIDSAGWLHTGDLAVRKPNGYYRITGRIKDMVIRGGENIYPREIEEFLFTLPAVEQVSVFGVPDSKFGEELCAWIRLKPGSQATPQDIRQSCVARLAHYKVPRYIRIVEEFPQTVTGKIQKFKMREQMVRELEVQDPETA